MGILKTIGIVVLASTVLFFGGKMIVSDNVVDMSEVPKSYTKEISDKDLQMVEEYLNETYELNLDVISGIEEYYEFGANGGLHYNFKIADVLGFNVRAELNYRKLNKENLECIILNITDFNLASDIKLYIDKNTDIDCELLDCRLVETDDEMYTYVAVRVNETYYTVDIPKGSEGSFEGYIDTILSKINVMVV